MSAVAGPGTQLQEARGGAGPDRPRFYFGSGNFSAPWVFMLRMAKFERMSRASRYYRRPPEYLSTHPVTTGRIADSRNRAEQYAYRQHPDSLSYHLVRARLRVGGTS